MAIESVELHNYCQHRRLVFEPAAGVNGVVGPNGSGKSNLLDAVYLGLTGESRTAGVKAACVCDRAGPGEASRVTVRFAHAGVRATVTRGLGDGDGAELRVEGEPRPVRGQRAVNARVEALLGLSRRMLADFVFVRQRDLAAFLDMDATDRLLAFQRLFGVHQAEAAWQLLGPVAAAPPAAASAAPALHVRAAEAALEVARLETRVAAAAAAGVTEGWREADDPDALALAADDRRAGLARARADAAGRAELAVVAVRAAEAGEASAAQALAGVASPDDAAVADAHAQLAAWAQYRRTLPAYEAAQAAADALLAEGAALARPAAPPEHYQEMSDAEQAAFAVRRREAARREAGLADYLAAFDRTGVVACPTCGAPQPDGRLEASRREHARLAAALADMSRVAAAQAAYDLAVVRREEALVRHRERCVEALTQLGQLEEGLCRPDTPEGDLRARLEEYSLARIRERRLQQAHAQAVGRLEQARGEMARANAALAELDAALAAAPAALDAGERAAAAARLEAARDAHRDLLKAVGALAGARDRLRADEGALAAAVEADREAAAARARADFAGRVRDVLHRTRLPASLSRRHLEVLRARVDDVLAELDQPFRIEAVTPALGFRLRFANGTVQPAERLSEGQKAVFALAVRIVVNAAYAGEVGMLFLDEPTEGLDADNMRALEAALARLRALSRSSGLQCFLVTHERGLSHLFDRVLELAPPS